MLVLAVPPTLQLDLGKRDKRKEGRRANMGKCKRKRKRRSEKRRKRRGDSGESSGENDGERSGKGKEKR